MLGDSFQSTHKYFKVLYGPLDHVFHITLHNKPYKYIVLFDDSFRQIRKIDISNVSSFQTRCVQSESTINVLNRKQTVITKKYLIEIHFGALNKHPLTFTTVSFYDCQLLSEEIEKTFGVKVYNYGSLNTAFKNALKSSNEAELVTEEVDDFNKKLDAYHLHRNAYELKNLYDFAQLDYNEHTEPLAEITTKFPVVIEGNMEDGSFISYRDISNKSNVSSSVYKVEWYLSKSVGNSEEFFPTATETSDTFYLSEYMIGHFVMVKVYRALKFNENRTFVFSTAQRGPIYPSTILCHHILINSTKKPDHHETLISTLDLDVLFNVVDKSNRFGIYEPFNNSQVISNFAYYQQHIKDNEAKPEKKEIKQPVKILINDKTNAKQESKNEVTETDDGESDNELSNDNANKDPDSSLNVDSNLEKNGSNNSLNNVDNNENEGVKSFKPNSIKLKVPSKSYDSEEEIDDEQAQQPLKHVIDLLNLNEEDASSLKFLYGEQFVRTKDSDLKDIHETTTVSELSNEGEFTSIDVDELFDEPKKKKFSLFGIFQPNKKDSGKTKLNPIDSKAAAKNAKKMKKKQPTPRPSPNGPYVVDFKKKFVPSIKGLPGMGFNDKAPAEMYIPALERFYEAPVEELDEQTVIDGLKDLLKDGEFERAPASPQANKSPNSKPPQKMPMKQMKEETPKAKNGKKVVYSRKYEKQLKSNKEKQMKNGPAPTDQNEPEEELDLSPKSPKANKKMQKKNEKSMAGKGGSTPKGGNRMANKNKNMALTDKGTPKNRRYSMKNAGINGNTGGPSPMNAKMKGKPEKSPKSKRAVYNKKYEKQMREKKLLNSMDAEEPDEIDEMFQNQYNNKNLKKANHQKKPKNQFKGFFGLFNKQKNVQADLNAENEAVTNDETNHGNENNLLNAESFKQFIDTIKFVPIELKICLNELVIKYGLASLNLKWRTIDVEKADQLIFDQFPSMQKQLENKITIIYKCSIPIRICLKTQSTFQRNVLFHSIIFNKYRSNYSIDRCERELANCYYNGIRLAYTKACRALYEHKKRNEETDQKEAVTNHNQMQLNVFKV